MKYTVLSIAYPLTPVGPDAVGGSEQILTLLDANLSQMGHRSLVIAAEGSKVSGTLIPALRRNGHLDELTHLEARQVHARLIGETLKRFQVDLVHMHSLDFHAYLPDERIPVLATLHLPPDWYPSSIFVDSRPDFYLNCVSASQQRACPPSGHLLPYVPNGVAVERFITAPVKQNYALAMGRICPEKGFHFAIEAARTAGCDLLLAGEVAPYRAHLDYFEAEIAPRIDQHIRFIGPVGAERKGQLLAEARCLLVPSTVAETSSLVAMEAFAAGTPVVAFNSGALPEIVEDGRNGFLVSDTEAMAAAIRKAESIDPEICQTSARERFSSGQMARRYFDLYEQIIRRASSVAA